MVLKEPLPTASGVAPSVSEKEHRWVEPADGWLAAGVFLCGTMLLGPFGAIPLIIGLVKLWRSVKAGTNVRPWAATVIGAFCMIDGMINFMPWSLDTFAHNTVLGETFMTGYGRFFDGAFFLHYNQGALGGVENHTEKMWQLLAVFVVMPMRVVSAWAFLQMKTWGLHFMKISSWLYLLLWTGYTMALSLDFQERMATSMFGMGWWLFNLFYLSPMFVLPYLYTVDKRQWNR
jgi:uncharacterized protein (DUF983 family)